MTDTLQKYYLLPSGIFVEKEPHVVDTVLGSCVAVCLYDDRLKVGGINHYMLPFWNGQGLASPKYGNIAMDKLIEKMELIGSKRTNMIAKVFGGANQMQSSLGVGQRNVMMVKDYLADARIPIVAENVGGEIGRKIRFNTNNGQVLMKFLQKQTHDS
ncbi:chemotaxis protein CheD [Marinoscillum pacificum]|uniref:chemotaxis protein CheD n=1 Tax=Marinoscillum pacificum TaxID=392723 RepID=UPI0021580B7F|nr:chemotaxis protein CheD [Marinoscillum pacificum]